MGQRFDSFSFFDGTSMTPVTQVTWADYWRGVVPDGVVGQYLDEMRPYGNSTGMYVYISAGACFADNHRGNLAAAKQLAIPAADGLRDRIDVVVARVSYGNENESFMELDLLEGTPDIEPVAPAVTQSTGGVYEIKLAEVTVAAGAITITAEDVTDCRNVFSMGKKYFTFVNADNVGLEKGMLVKISNNMEEAVERANFDDIVAGVVEAEYIAPGARGYVNTKTGDISEIRCDEAEVSIGDVLIPSETNIGCGHPGGVRFSGGIALQAKASGAVGNVKSLLTIFSKLPTQNKWYLVNDLTDADVLAAFQFVGRGSAADALTSLNLYNNVPFVLAQTSSAVTWDAEKGFYIPPTRNSGLSCDDLYSQATVPLGAIFGYSGLSTTNNDKCAGGFVISNGGSLLQLHGYANSGNCNGKISMNRRSTAPYNIRRSPDPTPANGIVSCDWGEENRIYFNGIEIGTEDSGSTASSGGENNYKLIFGQTDYGSVSYTGFWITAGVLYSTALSPSDHYELSRRISGLGGTI